MEKTKWVLPSEKNHENRFMLRIEQAESDLTDALDMLERCSDAFAQLVRQMDIDHIRTYNETDNFISKFRQPK